MVLKPYSVKPRKLALSIIFVSVILLFLTIIFRSNPKAENHSHQLGYKFSYESRNHKPKPGWLEAVIQETNHENLKIALVNVDKMFAKENGLLGTSEFVNVQFEPVDSSVRWKDLFPEWINETSPIESQECPEIPMPNFEDYEDLDVVVARVPCVAQSSSYKTSKGSKDILRLQVNLVIANLLVKNGITSDDGGNNRDIYLVLFSSCDPMLDLFKCDDLLWQNKDKNVRVYRPELTRLKHKLTMPVGTCQLAPPYTEPGQEIWRRSGNGPREAYVTVLHSSETYICGAIALAQSILRSGTNKDLVLLADKYILPESRKGLTEAGWKVKSIKRIRSPNAKGNAYNKWNYSKFRIWQLTEYDKVIFIDSDILLLRNIDHFFVYPQLSAAGNNRHIFNSGMMLIEPSNCTFNALMKERFTIVSYNGGDQGFLNEMFTWWHRWPKKINFLKTFEGDEAEREIPQQEELYAIHYLGMKPWMCYEDYDCNWDFENYRRYASDTAHQIWWNIYHEMSTNLQSFCALTKEMDLRISEARKKSKEAKTYDEHWKIEVKDPRRNFRKFNPTWVA